jgi:hypothetical protein
MYLTKVSNWPDEVTAFADMQILSGVDRNHGRFERHLINEFIYAIQPNVDERQFDW